MAIERMSRFLTDWTKPAARFLRLLWLTLLVAGLVACSGSDPDDAPENNPEAGRGFDPGRHVSAVVTLDQNWSDEQAVTFYNQAQGSRLVPYDWFLHLEQADNQQRFADNEHIRSFGYLAREPGAGNPDGLPIGFVRGGDYADGTAGLGITCAACHTAQINFTTDGMTTAYLIDGGPTLADFEGFQQALEDALSATSLSDAKFNRFADRVMPQADDAQREDLRQRLTSVVDTRSRFNDLNLSGDAPDFGYGRVDAFGGIMNQVAVEFIGNPANHAPANAPVSYPFLWDTPQHDTVEWNGSSPNTYIPILGTFIGTNEVGALVRNAGQVLGVFGSVDPAEEQGVLGGYTSSLNSDSMIAINQSLKDLWSPLWPEAFGRIDQDRATEGAGLFATHCQGCHENQGFDRTDPRRSIKAQMRAVGTDQLMAENYAMREADTGVLAGRYQNLASIYTGDVLSTREPLSDLVKHMAIRAAFGQIPLGSRESFEVALSSGATPAAGRQQPANVAAHQGAGYVYKARPLNGIWATAPYLHNGSVPNLWELLKSPDAGDASTRRSNEFFVGSKQYDPVHVGFRSDQGPFRFDTTLPGNSNSGHDFGTDLEAEQKWALIEYLKTL